MGPFLIEYPGVRVEITFEAYEENGRKVCGIYQIDGEINRPPKAWLAIVRAEVAKIADIARNAGCDELRIAGRDWSRVLPEFEPFDGPVNGIRRML